MRISLLLAAAVTPLLAVPALADCADDIKAILKSAQMSGPYTMETTVSSSAGEMTMTAEVDPPTAMHSVTVTGGQTIEMILLDGRAWMNMGSWTEMPAEQVAQMTAMFDPNVIDTLGDLTDAECAGISTVDGEDYLVFNYGFGMEGISTENTMYVDPETNLPVSLDSTADMNGEMAETSVSYEYVDSVTIEAPAM